MDKLALVDFIKIKVMNVDLELLKQKLQFEATVDEETGLITKEISKYIFCKIVVKTNSKDKTKPHVNFQGSIHKLWNEINGIRAPNYRGELNYKGYNGNQYYYSDFQKTVKHIEELFNCNSSNMIIENIEFGYNLKVNFNPNLFLNGLLYHKNIKFDSLYNGTYRESIHGRFIFKIYNKSLQYGISKDIMRVELKIKKMIEIKNLYIVNLNDVNLKTFNKAAKLIINRLNELIYYDYTIEIENLPTNLKKHVSNYKDVNYWLNGLKPNYRDRHKKRLNEIIENHSSNLRNKIIVEIEKCLIINH